MLRNNYYTISLASISHSRNPLDKERKMVGTATQAAHEMKQGILENIILSRQSLFHSLHISVHTPHPEQILPYFAQQQSSRETFIIFQQG